MTTRRGFLGTLLKGGAVGAAAVAAAPGYAIGADKGEPGGEFSAFNFICVCDRSVIGKVPTEVGATIEAKCECGREYVLEWRGEFFITRSKIAHDISKGLGYTGCSMDGGFHDGGRRQIQKI